MAQTKGVLRIDLNTMVSRLDTGTARPRLAKLGPGDQFGNATEFLENQRNLVDGDFISVEGTGGSIIFITDARLASATEVAATTTGAGGVPSRSAGQPRGGREVGVATGRKSASRKSSGKAAAAKKGGAKKGATKKAAAKKAVAKKGTARKKAAKRGAAKKSASRKTRKGSKGK